MENLFKDADAVNYYQMKDARKQFSDSNKNMKSSIHEKTLDPENVNYDHVNLEVYHGVGLGKNWRVGKSETVEELQKATEGFDTVSDKFHKIDTNHKKASHKILSFISYIFRKRQS